MAKSIKDIASDIRSQKMAKTNLFKVNFPAAPAGAAVLSADPIEFRAKGSQLPTSELGTLEVPYRGRKLKVPAQRTFSDWTVTIMETEEMGVRSALEEWMDFLDNAETGERDSSKTVDATVEILKGDGKSTALKFILYGAYPTNIGAIELNFDEQSAPLEYSVTFAYSYHKIEKGSGGGGGGAGS